MRLAWINDCHFNFIKNTEAFGKYLTEDYEFDAVVIAGDISEAPLLIQDLKDFSAGINNKPLYFVTGNHDYYHSSHAKVSRALHDAFKDSPNITYLTNTAFVQLDSKTALVGEDGWYDATAGDPEGSMVYMSDFDLIEELSRCLSSDLEYPRDVVFARGDRWPLINYCRELGQLSVLRAKPKLVAAAGQAETVIFATHVPPFPKATWHQGKQSNADWLPWFCNVQMGEMLSEVADACPDNNFVVLCGHTHGEGIYNHSQNLVVHTGKAEYRVPDISKIFTLPF